MEACFGATCDISSTVRVPAGVQLSYLFVGADYSVSTKVTLSARIHPWLGRPDCAAGRFAETTLTSGTGSQSDVSGPDVSWDTILGWRR
eukprot:2927861-Rhodomonas_salina.1